jgi:hypothetical protein
MEKSEDILTAFQNDEGTTAYALLRIAEAQREYNTVMLAKLLMDNGVGGDVREVLQRARKHLDNVRGE